MNENIIESVKNLSQYELVQFKNWLDGNYNELYDSKITPYEISRFKELGDEICNMLNIASFPVSGVAKEYDAPYETYIHSNNSMWEQVTDYLYPEDESDKIDNIWNNVIPLFEKMKSIANSSWKFNKEEAAKYYPGERKYIFYVKGGGRKYVTNRREFENCLKCG